MNRLREQLESLNLKEQIQRQEKEDDAEKIMKSFETIMKSVKKHIDNALGKISAALSSSKQRITSYLWFRFNDSKRKNRDMPEDNKTNISTPSVTNSDVPTSILNINKFPIIEEIYHYPRTSAKEEKPNNLGRREYFMATYELCSLSCRQRK